MSTNDTDTSESRVSPQITDDAVEEDGGSRTTGEILADDLDVEGHSMGAVHPTMARLLSDSKERDIARKANRESIIGQVKRAVGKKS